LDYSDKNKVDYGTRKWVAITLVYLKAKRILCKVYRVMDQGRKDRTIWRYQDYRLKKNSEIKRNCFHATGDS